MPLKLFLFATVALALLAALTGCASSAPRSSRVSYGEGIKVSGVITYRERVAMPRGAVVTARLVDITQPADSARLLCEQRITAPGQVPVPFVLTVDPETISENRNYAIEATIRAGGEVRWRNTQQYGVITRGNPTSGLTVWVQQVD